MNGLTDGAVSDNEQPGLQIMLPNDYYDLTIVRVTREADGRR
jgi:hypothetical protein